MAGEVIVDALPYIDSGYDDPGIREAALALVEEECRRYRPTKNYLDHLPLNTNTSSNSFETKLMTHEFERIQNRMPMETLSMKRYELPPPTAGRLMEVTAWQEAIENSYAQLEHQAVRVQNLELMLEYGCEAWKAYLEIFTALQAKAQTELQELKKEIQDVNWQRKLAQTQAGEKLRALEAHWVMLVSKNYEIEQECVLLEEKITRLTEECEVKAKNKERGDDNKENVFENGNNNNNRVPSDEEKMEDEVDEQDEQSTEYIL